MPESEALSRDELMNQSPYFCDFTTAVTKVRLKAVAGTDSPGDRLNQVPRYCVRRSTD